MTVYVSSTYSRAALIAAAVLTPDAPQLPTDVTWWADKRNHIWVETERPSYLRSLNVHTGRARRAMWPALLVWSCYGPLTDVTP
jgi:hypothetical protein